jgi:hypothetical protein
LNSGVTSTPAFAVNVVARLPSFSEPKREMLKPLVK